MRSLVSLVSCSVAIAALVPACGSGDESAGQSFGGAGGQQGGAGGGSGRGGTSEIFGDDASVPIRATDDGGLTGQVGSTDLGDAACASEVRKGEQTPLDIYIALDSSGSMTDAVGGPGAAPLTKWEAVSKALVSFVDDPASAGLGVGLQYFPIIKDGIPATCNSDAVCRGAGPCDIPHVCTNRTVVEICNTRADCAGDDCVPLGQCASSEQPCAFVGERCSANNGLCLPMPGYCRGRDACTTAPYAMPAVPIAPLPGVAPAIVQSLSTHAPDGLTPTSSALAGALAHARSVATAHPERRVVVLLVTDGLPTECDPTDIASISAMAATASAATPAIATFVIGVFAPAEAQVARSNLDAIAKAGSSDRALIVQTNQNVSQAFLQALNTIRTTALSCEYTIPLPQAGALDYESVNVRFTSTAGKTTTLGYAGSACGSAGGWYYDQPLGAARAPTKIVMCPTTCASLKVETRGQVNVLFGCKTESVVR